MQCAGASLGTPALTPSPGCDPCGPAHGALCPVNCPVLEGGLWPGSGGGGGDMPVRFKGLSEYQRNFLWKKSYLSEISNSPESQKSPWAGLRSDQIGITKEPSFISKKRVPYYDPEIPKYLEWKAEDGPENELVALPESEVPEVPKLQETKEKGDLTEERILTPEAPRVPKRVQSHSADSKVEEAVDPVDDNKEAISDPTPMNRNAETQKCTQGLSENVHNQQLDRILRRKAGLSVAPIYHSLRNSEYQRQFVWKTPKENSPVLAADQVFFSKNKSVPPFKVDVTIPETEYKRNFKGLSPKKERRYRNDLKENENPEIDSSEKFQSSNKENSSKQREEEMELKDKISPPKYQRKANTEYRAKFLSPSQYLYRDGAWKRVRENTLNQVKELREKAEFYRKRVLGTHFSRDHLNQILSDNNCLWDVSSVSSSEGTISNNIRALDLAGIPTGPKTLRSHDSKKKAEESPPLAAQCQKDATEKLGVSDVPTLPVRRKLAWDEGSTDDQIHNHERRMEEEKNEGNKQDGVEETKELEENDADAKRDRSQEGTASLPNASTDRSEASSVSSGKGGWLPTPKLKELGGAPRTHHDLTTPAVGGAVLVSPTKVKSSFLEHRKKKPSPDFLGEISKNESNRKELGPRPLLTPPAAGMKTMDPLPLRAEIETSISKPEGAYPGPKASEHSIKVPMQGTRPLWAPLYWNPSCRIQGALRNAEFQHNGNFVSPRTSHYNLPHQEVNYDEDDDRLSQISARSAASSLMASQTLARAKKRKENFWGKK
ncbi:nuclear protein MDM1 isoform X2 [Sarcophilus harrisii]|uniref:Nuclear protein MDM1 n=1 Tax=Sarcophilus harrisii TaxID=9305 RepID=A0A7N4V4P4_SARHA|nr:nuclear protein MDM1 isoform X2 [Sarcophilus harrisii]